MCIRDSPYFRVFEYVGPGYGPSVHEFSVWCVNNLLEQLLLKVVFVCMFSEHHELVDLESLCVVNELKLEFDQC